MGDDLRDSEERFRTRNIKDPDYFARDFGSREPRHKSYLISAPSSRFGRLELGRERENYSSLGRFVDPSCSFL